MKNIIVFLLITFQVLLFTHLSLAQNDQKDKAIMREIPEGRGYYNETIMKDIKATEATGESVKTYKRFQVDFTGMHLPNKVDMYTSQWHNKTISQGNTGTCWDFSTTSFIESEIYRQTKQEVRLSEMYTVYWEYVEKAKRFVQERGNSVFAQGSEGNAVSRIYKKYGIVPSSVYDGKLYGEKFYNHDPMYNEMNSYLQTLKRDNNWNEEVVISTIKSILNHYMGEPPVEFNLNGKKYTPKQYLADVLKINMDDFVDILSYMQQPFWKKVEYETEDNWWHDKSYYNVPVNDFIKIVKEAIRKGFTIAIGGDVSEPGFDRDNQVGIIPTFDIPSAYIDDYAKEMRFSDKSTTDDHGMHLVGYMEQDGKDWFLIKDSSSGSRNNDPTAKEFGYYFMNEDYIKLKIMDITLHKDAVKEVLKKF